MAIFPDRIVQKNSTATTGEVFTAVGDGGSDPIVGGELVVVRGNGLAQLVTVDANGTPVMVGVAGISRGLEPSILLNFEEDGTDTPYEYVLSIFSSTAKFGSQSYEHLAAANTPRPNAIKILRENTPSLGADPWTLNFWFRCDFAAEMQPFWDDITYPFTPLILSSTNYTYGPGAFTITLDGGTVDAGGIGTATSRTSDLARGAIVFGLGGMFGSTESTDPLIPTTGEVVTTANAPVGDGNWHYITIQHEGGGAYSSFVDGQLKERNFLTGPINHNDPGTSGIPQPSGFELGGTVLINDNTPFPGIEYYGFRGRIDAFTLYAGEAIHKGLRSFAVPTTAPDMSMVQVERDTLRTLIDTNIDETPGSGDVLVYNSLEQAWENTTAPAFNISGNNLGDIGDVVFPATSSIADGEVVAWDAANTQWINKSLSFADLGVDVSNEAAGNVLRYDGFDYVSTQLQYSDLANIPADLQAYTIGQLSNVVLTSVQDADVLMYNSALGKWTNNSNPPLSIGGNSIFDLGDVNNLGHGYLYYGGTTVGVKTKTVAWNEISGRPDNLGDLDIGDLDLGDLSNNHGYIDGADLEASTLEVHSDVTYSATPSEGQMLIYRSSQWVNEFGPPANINNSSIGDMADVSRQPVSQSGEGAELTFEDVSKIHFDDPNQASNIEYSLSYDRDIVGVGISSIRELDNSGSSVFASRTGGVDLRSDINYFRLRGSKDVTTNRPELRFETGDSFASPASGRYISLKMPSVVLEDQVYYLPQEDGDVGDVLATNGLGELSWVARVQNNELGQLTDVDLATQLPVDGSALVYNAAASIWVPGNAQVNLSTSSLNDMADVAYGGAPGTGQALLWTGTAWVPGDISVSSNIIDADDIGTAPTAGQFLAYDGSEFNGVTLATVAITNDYDDLTNKPTLFSGDYDDLTNKPTLFSGDYDDLTNKPTIPSAANDLSDIDTVTTAPVIDQALVWDGSSWVPGDVAVDEASPAIVWDVTNIGLLFYGFTGSGFSSLASNPTLYVVRGQKYTFNKTVSAHPFELVEADGTTQYTDGVVESQPLALGELNWTVPMDAPSELGYRCTSHSSMKGSIKVVGVGVDLATSNIEELANVSSTAPTTGEALVWDGTNWAPADVLSSYTAVCGGTFGSG